MNSLQENGIKPKNGLEYVSCAVCGADDAEFLFRHAVRPHQVGVYARDEWDILRCRRCGLIYENPRPDAAALAYFYQFNDTGDREFAQNWFIENADLHRANYQRYLKLIRVQVSGGRLLDVGAGGGSFLVEARKAGFVVTGQDVSPFFIQHCRETLGLEMLEGELEDQQLPAGSFDCITTFDVIEHHPHPKQLVQEICRLLKPGGLFVVGTHDVGSFFARLYGPNWRYMVSIAHLNFFNRETITRLLESCGFEVIRFGGIHTIDENGLRVAQRWIVQFFRLVFLRALILWLYRPVTSWARFLQNWQFSWKGRVYNHKKLLERAGTQVAMNDNFICLAVRKG